MRRVTSRPSYCAARCWRTTIRGFCQAPALRPEGWTRFGHPIRIATFDRSFCSRSVRLTLFRARRPCRVSAEASDAVRALDRRVVVGGGTMLQRPFPARRPILQLGHFVIKRLQALQRHVQRPSKDQPFRTGQVDVPAAVLARQHVVLDDPSRGGIVSSPAMRALEGDRENSAQLVSSHWLLQMSPSCRTVWAWTYEAVHRCEALFGKAVWGVRQACERQSMRCRPADLGRFSG